MISIKNVFARPSLERAIGQQLEDSRFNLLEAEAHLELAAYQVEMLRTRISRLERAQALGPSGSMGEPGKAPKSKAITGRAALDNPEKAWPRNVDFVNKVRAGLGLGLGGGV